MSEATEDLVLEHLRHIRGRVDLIPDDMKEVKLRLSSLESSLSLVRREIIVGDETGARRKLPLIELWNAWKESNIVSIYDTKYKSTSIHNQPA